MKRNWRPCVAGVVALLAFAGPAGADGKKLTGAQIAQLLGGRTLYGPPDKGPSQQSFAADGTTLYQSPDKKLQGRWRVVRDTYCSSWDENTPPKCAAVFLQPPMVVFVGADGESHVLLLAK